MTPKPPITADSLPADWTQKVRDAASIEEGVPLRASPRWPIIEAYSINRKAWLPLTLPGGGTLFTSFGERNTVLQRITGK